jgi:hypothetical protein
VKVNKYANAFIKSSELSDFLSTRRFQFTESNHEVVMLHLKLASRQFIGAIMWKDDLVYSILDSVHHS